MADWESYNTINLGHFDWAGREGKEGEEIFAISVDRPSAAPRRDVEYVWCIWIDRSTNDKFPLHSLALQTRHLI